MIRNGMPEIFFLINNKDIGELSNPKKDEPTKDYGILEEIAKSINTR